MESNSVGQVGQYSNQPLNSQQSLDKSDQTLREATTITTFR